ncbi:helix-turn-helix transcriptional regulator [Myroides odoratimimus]|uniref:helix-turn-helix domain-containing protein n=1 Tax=Myroides odoratimimus TaxID=76832 RepID=UPI00257704EB|nr:helix-turn-helix transcriptional regulator [Myroides odoratimimus]MDM1525251.1 helix-turn-helix transcriptional regulator [Myroides odoratimimus]
MKTFPLDQIIDEHIGKKGTKERDLFEVRVEIGRLGMKVIELRKAKGLTKKELARLAGVSKAQVKRIESDTVDVKIGTLLKVINELGLKMSFSIDSRN